MHIIYHSIARGNLSSIAAAIHVGNLPDHSVPSIDNLKDLLSKCDDEFDLVFNGVDESNNSVYSLNRLENPSLLIPTILEIFKGFNVDVDDIKLINLEALNYIRNSIPSYLEVVSSDNKGNLRYDEFNEFYFNIVDIVDSIKDSTSHKLNLH